MLKSKKCKIKLEGYEIERMRKIINALKDFNVATSDKVSIDYEIICELSGADNFLARILGLVQPSDKHGNTNWYIDYQWDEETD